MGGTVIRGVGGGGGNALDEVFASIAIASLPSSVNLSTEGTFDWLGFTSSGTQPRTLSVGACHTRRVGGGYLQGSFNFRSNGWTGLSQASPTTFQTTQSESQHNAALNATTRYGFFTSVASSVGSGWSFHVPCLPGPSDLSGVRRRIRIYASSFNAALTVTVRASDGSLAPISDSIGAAGAGQSGAMFEIEYVGPRGVDLIVDGIITSSSTNPNQAIGAITVEDLA